jgi:hypothetical protein
MGGTKGWTPDSCWGVYVVDEPELAGDCVGACWGYVDFFDLFCSFFFVFVFKKNPFISSLFSLLFRTASPPLFVLASSRRV